MSLKLAVCIPALSLVLLCWGQAPSRTDAESQTSRNANSSDQSRLNNAISRGDLSAVTDLIKAGVDANAKDSTGRTALIWAAGQGRLEIVRLLAGAGADLNVVDSYGWTAIKLAWEYEHYEIAQALVELGAQADPEELRRQANKKDALGRTPLQKATNANSVRAIVKFGGDVNALSFGRTVLMDAVSAGNLEQVRALVDVGADVNIRDRRGWTTLLLGSQLGYTEIVKTLVEAGADVNAPGPQGWNALMYASYFGHLDTARVLIPVTDPNHRNDEGISALMLARWACHRDIEDALTRAGAVAGAEEWKRPPAFEDFPVAKGFKGTPARVDLDSNPQAPTYRTRLATGARSGPNFAGHYAVVLWGCGTRCAESMIVDSSTGRVYNGVRNDYGLQFRLDSSLMMAADISAIRYYAWKDDRFTLLYERACAEGSEPDQCGCEAQQQTDDHQSN